MSTQPSSLGPYQILNKLGAGSFAEVYRALDTRRGHVVALKVLYPHVTQQPEAVARFKREAAVMQQLQHPHIVQVLESDVVEGRAYLAQELIEGETLAVRLKRQGPFTFDAMLDVLRPICEALDYCHQQSVVHRDLKPGNILLNRRGTPFLADFGIARLVSEATIAATRSTSFLGSPEYAAPELWDEGEATEASDIYALGCIVVELLTGQPLFQARTPIQFLKAHERGPKYPSWPSVAPSYLAQVLDRALARDSMARYSSAMSLWNAFQGPVTQSLQATTVMPEVQKPAKHDAARLGLKQSIQPKKSSMSPPSRSNSPSDFPEDDSNMLKERHKGLREVILIWLITNPMRTASEVHDNFNLYSYLEVVDALYDLVKKQLLSEARWSDPTRYELSESGLRQAKSLQVRYRP